MPKWLGCPNLDQRLSREKYRRYVAELGRLSRLSPSPDSLEILILDDQEEVDKVALRWYQQHWHEGGWHVKAPPRRLRPAYRQPEQLDLI
jgi:hypothetical protein